MSLLNEIQQKLKVPKGQYNAFAKYHYRNAEDILEAVKPLLGDNVLIITDEVVQVGDRYYVKATARLTEVAEEETVFEATGWAREELDKKGMDAAQITGAASSYARKYALNGLFCIDDTKDADTQSPEAPKQALPATKPAQTVKATAPAMTVAQAAARDRIKAALAMLGEKNDTMPEVSEAVQRLTGLQLQIANFDTIGEKLWAIVEAQVDPTK